MGVGAGESNGGRIMITEQIRSWMSLGRVSNLPTVVTNILVGTAVAASLGGEPSMTAVVVLSIGVALLYVGGMALNDLCDQRRDEHLGVPRPLVTGAISPGSAVLGVVVAFGAAMAILLTAATGISAILATVLLATIILYNRTHRRFTGVAPILLGLCRGIVYAMAAAETDLQSSWGVIIAVAALGGAYGGLITSAASREGDAHPRRAPLGLVLLPCPLIFIVLLVHSPWSPVILVAILLSLAWWSQTLRYLHSQRATLRTAIMRSLAGYALMDTVILLSLADLDGAIIATACFIVTLMAHRSISGT